MHTGSEEDLATAEELYTYIQESVKPGEAPIQVEYQRQFPASQREHTIARNIKKYSEQDMSIILIVTTSLFSTVWPTSSKSDILNSILHYKNNRCLHIWAEGIKDTIVKRFSTGMTSTLQSFRKIPIQELRTSPQPGKDIVYLLNTVKLQDELYATNFPAKGVLEEAARVREKKKHMKPLEAQRYEESLNVLHSTKLGAHKTTPMEQQGEPMAGPRLSNPPNFIDPFQSERQQPSPHTYCGRTEQKLQVTPHETARNLIDIAATASKRDPQPVQAATTRPRIDRKKSKPKRISAISTAPVNEYEIRLNTIKYLHLFELSDRLDYSASGNDYKRLAVMYKFTRDDIEQLGLSTLRGQRPTEQFIRYLNMRMPELTVKDFEGKCAEMQRNDVVKYIQEKIYGKK